MKKIIAFGVGRRLDYLMQEGYLEDFEVLAFCDNDVAKQGKMIGGLEIISPARIKEYTYDSIYVTSKKYYEEIRRGLEEEWKIDRDRVKYFRMNKYDGELSYWRERFIEEGGEFKNSHYKKLMLGIAEQEDDDFLRGMVVADFGCGPRGSLQWTDKPRIKLGIDVLAKDYMDHFGEELAGHNMIYVTSSEKHIPLPTGFVDCLFTINSLDHVDNLQQMAGEILRILKHGGTLLASFNLNEPCTECEPQTLTEDLVRNLILDNFTIESYRLAYKEEGDTYRNIFNNKTVTVSDEEIKPVVLWVKGKKK